jgi:hypothetical protein
MFKCYCDKSVRIGDLTNQITLPTPKHIGYKTKPTICIDKCMLEEIKKVWSYGVRTSGCCCGHNQKKPYIGVLDDKSAVIMRLLGYKQMPEMDGSYNHHFYVE